MTSRPERHLLRALLALSCAALLAGCSDDECNCVVPDPEGEWVAHAIGSHEYVRNRFFRLTSDAEATRIPTGAIDPPSVRVYRRMGIGNIIGDEIANVAVFADSTGLWTDNDFTADPAFLGIRWRPVDFDPREPGALLVDEAQNWWGIDLGSDQGDAAVLAVTFAYHAPDGYRRVGDDPYQAPTGTVYSGGQPLAGDWYRMKLLKAPIDEDHALAHALMIRQVYPLGRTDIDPEGLRLRIESLDPADDTPRYDENGVDYLRIFGLDQGDFWGAGFPDGEADLVRADLFDLRRGLVLFPESLREPFAADPDAYAAYAAGSAFAWSDTTYLARNLVPELYAPGLAPAEFPQYGRFRFVAEHYHFFAEPYRRWDGPAEAAR